MTEPSTPGIPAEWSRNERVKAASDQLRGDIAAELGQDTARFTDASGAILKFHGVYQQDDRDGRQEARRQGSDKRYQMMVRTRIPGGVVSADGYLGHDEAAERWGNGTLRITTRQDFQMHGVLKGDLRDSIAAINRTLLTTLGGCGDQARNVMCCPAPVTDRFHSEARAAVAAVARSLMPTTRAYHEIWLDGELTATSQAPDPLYGPTYLPRKFKTAVALEGDNCVDVYANDLGLVAMRGDDGEVRGFTVLAGGGLGQTHNKPATFPAVARPVGYVDAGDVVDVARAVVSVHRDFGDRRDRRHARLKYVIAERGLDWFRSEVQQRLAGPLREAPRLRWRRVEDHLGWSEQGDGLLALGVFVENGRIADGPTQRLRTALRRAVGELRCTVRLTPQQNLILSGIERGDRPRVDALLRDHGVTPAHLVPLTVRNSLACPALPTCGLAVAEAERVMPDLVRQMDTVAAGLGLQDAKISYRMTGCPNGCARPYLGDVGIVGTTLGKYDVYLGGDFEGTRLNRVYAHNVPLGLIATLLQPVLAAYGEARWRGEGFGDWCERVGVDTLRRRFTPDAAPVAAAAAAG